MIAKPTALCLWSALSPAECAARLAAAVDPESSLLDAWARATLEKPVIGSVKGASVRLRKRTELYRNSFQTYLTAELRPDGTGTAITGTMGLHPFVWAFMALWFAVLTLVGGLAALMFVASFVAAPTVRQGASGWGAVLILPGMLAFGIALVAFGRYLARSEAGFLVDFMVRTLDAEVVPAN